MPGELNLPRLIKAMKPVLNEGDYVFCSFAEGTPADLSDAICTFREKEGVTVILPKEIADKRQLKYTFIASWITLMVHSSLEAVGLTAAASKALAAQNISANVVAGFYHDHIFVPRRDAEKAIRALREIGNK